MNISNELIDLFFKKKCSAKEADFVSNYLQQNPSVLDDWLVRSEWEESAVTSEMPGSFWNKQWKFIKRENKGGSIILLMKRAAVAAVLLIAVGMIYYWAAKDKSKPDNISNINVSTTTKCVVNNSESIVVQALPDGSVVELRPYTSIIYKKNFNNKIRDIELKGEAVFKVSKDKTRPFIVRSGNITTTALGTKFKVIYWGSDKKTQVHLYEGRVVVKSILSSNKTEQYLNPGDDLSYFKNVFTVNKEAKSILTKDDDNIANNRRINTGEERNDNKIMDNNNAGNKIKNSIIILPQWYKFEKESLVGVFNDLASLYNVSISYDRNDLRDKYFIGKFDKTSSIEKILKTIADLNQLKVVKIDEVHYEIK